MPQYQAIIYKSPAKKTALPYKDFNLASKLCCFFDAMDVLHPSSVNVVGNVINTNQMRKAIHNKYTDLAMSTAALNGLLKEKITLPPSDSQETYNFQKIKIKFKSVLANHPTYPIKQLMNIFDLWYIQTQNNDPSAEKKFQDWALLLKEFIEYHAGTYVQMIISEITLNQNPRLTNDLVTFDDYKNICMKNENVACNAVQTLILKNTYFQEVMTHLHGFKQITSHIPAKQDIDTLISALNNGYLAMRGCFTFNIDNKIKFTSGVFKEMYSLLNIKPDYNSSIRHMIVVIGASKKGYVDDPLLGNCDVVYYIDPSKDYLPAQSTYPVYVLPFEIFDRLVHIRNQGLKTICNDDIAKRNYRFGYYHPHCKPQLQMPLKEVETSTLSNCCSNLNNFWHKNRSTIIPAVATVATTAMATYLLAAKP